MTHVVDPLLVAVEVAQHLERLHIPYLLGGSLASMLHGEPRATLDVDFAVHMTPDQARRLAEALDSDFHVIPDALVEAATIRRMANVLTRRSFMKVDFHVRVPSGHSREEMRRASVTQIGDTAEMALRVATPEDIVLQKLRWYRMGDEVSDRQWRDILGVLKRSGPRMDRAYMQHWARELGVTDLLARAFAQSNSE